MSGARARRGVGIMEADQIFLVARVGDDRIPLRLETDPERTRPAMAHGLGCALCHDAPLPAGSRARIVRLATALAAEPAAATNGTAAARRLAELLREIDPSAVLELRRRAFVGQHVPRWVGLRHGEAARGEIWPFDPELAALRIGRRSVLKRERADSTLLAAERAWLEGHGLHVAESAGVLFAARDRAGLDEAIALEAALGSPSDEAVRTLGARLGYPACCVAAFASSRRRDDATLFAELLPPLSSPPASPLTLWLDGAIAIVSHVPCSPSCTRTIELASAILAELDAQRPGFAARWREIAARLHVIDEHGRCYALGVEGNGPWHVVSALELRAEARGPAGLVRRETALEGVDLREDDGLLVGPGLRASLVADHRGG